VGVRGEATLKAQIEIPLNAPEGRFAVDYELVYQACTEEYCLLPITLTLPAIYTVRPAGVAGEAPPSLWNTPDIATALSSGGWPLTFLLVFVFGVLTSFTPCIYPMIPITLAILGVRTQSSTRWQGFLLSVTYVLGIALTYALLGLTAAKTGALFGQVLAHPLVTALIVVTFALMALSMFGLFEVQAPAALRDRLAMYRTGPGYGGAFVSGLIAGIVASPCVGPVLVSILAYVATTQNTLLGFSLLFVFALGLGQIFILLGTSSTLLQRLYRAGPWMARIKFLFGIVMLAMAAHYARPFFAGAPAERAAAVKLDWKDYSDEAYQRAKQSGKPILIDFWATWCAACFELEEKTFADERVRALSRKFNLFKFNATSSSPELKSLQERYGIMGLPHLVFYDREGRHAKDLTLTGFEDAPRFMERMQKALR
jgi:thiol:disulfide interchange protein